MALTGAATLTADAGVDAAGFRVLRDTLHATSGGHSLTISDTGDNLLALAGGHLALAAACRLSADALVSAGQAALLASEPGFATNGHVLTIADTAAHLLALAPAVMALAGVSLLTQSALVNATTAALLAAMPGFSEADGATLTVQDDAAHLLAFSQAMRTITGVEELPQGGVTLTASQAAGLLALGHFVTADSIITVADTVAALSGDANVGWASIAGAWHVTDTAANLAAAASSDVLQHAALVLLSGNAQILAAQAGQLGTISNFAVAAGQLTVVDGAAAIAAQQVAITSIGALAEINDNATIGAAQADALATPVGRRPACRSRRPYADGRR
ncbi:MAG: hypothetical protein WDN04_09155 [Rhodospirillales bacterium]